MSQSPLTLIPADHDQPEPQGLLTLPNDADLSSVDLTGISVIALQFPAFTDGRAFSQAQLLRRRRDFRGTLRATGDVLIDQLQQLQRCGFDEAVLRADQSLERGQQLLDLYQQGFYQGDASHPAPRFAQQDTPA